MSEEYGLKFVVNGEDYDKIKKSLNEQIEDLQQKVEQLEKENKELKYLADDSNTMKAFIVEHNKAEQLEKENKELKYLADDSNTMKAFIVEHNKAEQLEKENIKQKEIIENLTTMTVCGDKKQIKNTAQYKLEQLEKENDKLKHKLNNIAFGDDSELALRFLRKIDYVDFDEKRKVYINKHNNEPFLWKDEQEKDYYLKDEELNEYTQQLEYKVEQLENIRKEAIDYVYKHIQEYDVDGTFTNLDEFDFIASPQVLLNILNKGDNNGKKYI